MLYEVITHDNMSGHGPDHAKGNTEHNDQGLKIAFKGNGQQCKYTE